MPGNITPFSYRSCRFMTWSHSFEALGQERLGNVTRYSPRGSHFWLQAMMGPRFDAPYVASGKYGGQGTAVMVANTANVVADIRDRKINTLLFIGICNDSFQTRTALADIKTRITAMAKAVTDEGAYFICTTDIPAGGAYIRSAAQLRMLGDLQRWMFEELAVKSPLIIPIDIYKDFTQPGNTDGAPTGFTSLYDSDLLHPNIKGHFKYAYRLYQVLNELFPVSHAFPFSSQAFLYDTTSGSENKKGNILNNGMLTGSGGTVSGAAGSGSAPTNWTLACPATGASYVGSVGTDPDGTPFARITISGTSATSEVVSLRQDPSTSRFNQNDEHRGGAFIRVKAAGGNTGFTNLRGIELQATPSTSSPSATYQGVCGYNIAGDVWPNDFDLTQFNGGKGLFFRTPDKQKITGAWTTESPFARFNIDTRLEAAAAADVVVEAQMLFWEKTAADANFFT